MRETKFRGKSLRTGDWVIGQYHTYGDGHFIAQTELMGNSGLDRRIPAIEILPETLGQFTGKQCHYNETGNGYNELFQGDIVETIHGELLCVWNDDKCCFQVEDKNHCFDFHQIDITTQPIIGNIYDNPKLLSAK